MVDRQSSALNISLNLDDILGLVNVRFVLELPETQQETCFFGTTSKTLTELEQEGNAEDLVGVVVEPAGQGEVRSMLREDVGEVVEDPEPDAGGERLHGRPVVGGLPVEGVRCKRTLEMASNNSFDGHNLILTVRTR